LLSTAAEHRLPCISQPGSGSRSSSTHPITEVLSTLLHTSTEIAGTLACVVHRTAKLPHDVVAESAELATACWRITRSVRHLWHVTESSAGVARTTACREILEARSVQTATRRRCSRIGSQRRQRSSSALDERCHHAVDLNE